MNAPTNLNVSRRGFLGGSGALIVSFSLLPSALQAQTPPTPPPLPGGLNANRMLDAWIKIDGTGKITVFTGKAELGQGTRTALLQIAAEHLEVQPQAITFLTADTGLSPNEGFTAGSATISGSGVALMNAAAQTRQIIVALAAQKLGVPSDQLKAINATVVAPDGRSVKYAELIGPDTLHREAHATSNFKDPKTYAVVGKSMPRVYIPAKVTGGQTFFHDLRLPAM